MRPQSSWWSAEMKQTLSIFVFFLLVVSSSLVSAAESKGGLTVRESGANLYPQQDVESVPIAKLQKGEALIPVAEAIGQQTWYLVKTQQGLFGWVRGAMYHPAIRSKKLSKNGK